MAPIEREKDRWSLTFEDWVSGGRYSDVEEIYHLNHGEGD